MSLAASYRDSRDTAKRLEYDLEMATEVVGVEIFGEELDGSPLDVVALAIDEVAPGLGAQFCRKIRELMESFHHDEKDSDE